MHITYKFYTGVHTGGTIHLPSVSVCPSVCLSTTNLDSVITQKDFKQGT